MRRNRKKGSNKEKVFGCDLLEHLNASSTEIPQVLKCCSEFVETHGIVDGIYRLSGVSSNIQKLRGEFENDNIPDLNKELYLQDIHCVSSLCKAYFRELPNPLLTYQLYDKFAEAVAIQLEEERLVKIRDVLKELPPLHYRTLEFLMRHLVRMASYCSETNMHSRNLAIVWAPNLLRSKDIEASGFNGTAAFMEVRVQSIVVEFILTHVPQLFPQLGLPTERRKSLPSPSAACVSDEGFFKTVPTQPLPHFGNISPGDGPLAIRSYHSIIEGTDRRKGSLKGRKWLSIFGGRFPDPRRRHKHSGKEKEKPTLRPARSMDSLSTYPNEGPRHPGQRLPSTNISTSPLAVATPQPGSDAPPVSPGGIGGSEYAVTYRRGTGLVSGGGGTQGTYTPLDLEGLGGVTGGEAVHSRSPGLSTKVGRRQAMHITGPTTVTVPLHITNLAFVVLQGEGADRIVHRGNREKDGEKVERKERKAKERKAEKEEKNHTGKETVRDGVVDSDGKVAGLSGGGGENVGEAKKEEMKEVEKEEEKEVEKEVRDDCVGKPELVATGGRSVSREKRARSLTSNTEGENDEDAAADEYMDMTQMTPADFQPIVTQHVEDFECEASDVLNSTEMEGDDLGMSGYVQDNFEFLDQMDCSAMDHMDCSVSYQVNEFSVEPPGHSDDEYEVMAQAHTPPPPEEPHTQQLPSPEIPLLNPHRPLTLDIGCSRHSKSLSLPHMTSPILGPEQFSSEDEDVAEDDSDVNSYCSDDDDNDESMFVKSLPADFFLSGFEDIESNGRCIPDLVPDVVPECQLQSSEGVECPTVSLESKSACEESTEGEKREVKDIDGENGLEEKEETKEEEEVHLGNNRQSSKVTEDDHIVLEVCPSLEEQPPSSEAPTHCCAESPEQSADESSTEADAVVEKEKEEEEVVVDLHNDYPTSHTVSGVTQEETADVRLQEFMDISLTATEQPDGDMKICKEIDEICQEIVLEIKESVENMCLKTADEDNEEKPDKELKENMQDGGKEQSSAICKVSSIEFWDELEDVICEVIEDEESIQVEREIAREVAMIGDGEVKRLEKVSEEKEDVEDRGTDKVDVGIASEGAEESVETIEEKQQEFEERETNKPLANELGEAIQIKRDIVDIEHHHDGEEVVSEDMENNNKVDQCRSPTKAYQQDDQKVLKVESEQSDRGGVGRQLVSSKPKVYQAKAVPVVPPKPQHCKITALSLRQQQQQRERVRERTPPRVPTEQDRVGLAGRGRDGENDGENESGPGDANRDSPVSMCFDEAVAKATMRREKEKERDLGNEVQ